MMTDYLLAFGAWILGSFFVSLLRERREAALWERWNKLQAIVKIVLHLVAADFIAIPILDLAESWSKFCWHRVLSATEVGFFMGVLDAGSTYVGIAYGMVCARGVTAVSGSVAHSCCCWEVLGKKTDSRYDL